MPRVYTRVDLAERFWKKVAKGAPDDCWRWTACTSKGYGQIRVGDLQVKAHRLSFELHSGPIPSGLSVLHRCDVPTCVNPAHLFLGTNADNMSDMRAKGRSACGPTNGNAKLTDASVIEIRAQYAAGIVMQRELGRAFGVDQSLISLIVRRVRWTHLTEVAP
jgi:HNH endonuclease